MAQDDIDYQGKAYLEQFSRKRQQQEERVAAHQKNLTKVLAEVMKTEGGKKALARTQEVAVGNARNGNNSPQSQSGYNIITNDQVDTGFEPLPWEND